MIPESAFDILGPIMVGPSSSHTAGALRIARLAASLVDGEVKHVEFVLYSSFAHTYKGHGTDRALVAGILGFETDDLSIRDAFEHAHNAGLSFTFTQSDAGEGLHPNTVDLIMTDKNGIDTSARGESLGGGAVALTQINGVEVHLSADHHTLFVTHHDEVGALSSLTSLLAQASVNIAFMRSYRREVGGIAYTVFETDTPVLPHTIPELKMLRAVLGATVLDTPNQPANSPGITSDYNFLSAQELLEKCQLNSLSIGEIMLQREQGLGSGKLAQKRMQRVYSVMQDSVHAPVKQPQRSMGGLIGGEAHAVYNLLGTSRDIGGIVLTKAISYALATLECSATMGLIVAAPTAGASGVIPGVLFSIGEEHDIEEQELINALFTAAAVGFLIARNASVSGAEAGCQAEVGSASAMAAAAVVELMGGTPEQALHAASFALSNILGLVCDPIGGLVESPCQMRNAIGVSNAISSATIALAGNKSLVPFDEVAEVMLTVGKSLPQSLRETATGGLAVTKSACAACSSLCS